MNPFKLWEFFKINKKMILLVSGLFALLTCFFMGLSPLVSMGVISLVMAFWWIFEVLPLAGTALLPLVCYPMLGIMSTKKVAPVYMSSILMLFIGGFTVASGCTVMCLYRIAASLCKTIFLHEIVFDSRLKKTQAVRYSFVL